MLRKMGGIAVGVVAALMTIEAVEWLKRALFPPQPGYDVRDLATVRDYMEGAPIAAMLFVVAAWFLGSLVGGALAQWIARVSWARWAVAAIVLVLVVFTILMFPHPGWMVVAGFAAPLIAAWIVGRLPQPRSETS